MRNGMIETELEAVAEKKDAYTLSLFEESTAAIETNTILNRANLGTFQDSLRAPVHRWFTYPAGFSYRAVEEAFRSYSIRAGQSVYDPFAGTATTNLVAKQQGIRSYGVEAHPFVQFVAQTKLYWEFDFPTLFCQIDALIAEIRDAFAAQRMADIPVETIFPELVCKCYSTEKLAKLYLCREAIFAISDAPFRNFAKLGLTNLLRAAADVATGWPYIAPGKAKNTATVSKDMDIAKMLRDQLHRMFGDLQEIRRSACVPGIAALIAGDARKRHAEIADASVNLAFTSPPYLNNFDYADRTRLETYFWGDAKTWGDITRNVRTQLIMSATTQVNRTDYDMSQILSEDFRAAAPHLAAQLMPKVNELSKLRLEKGGKKSYDIMVAGYFNDMLLVLREAHRVLKPGASFLLILGDSAPYGVYIPIDIYLGEMGKAVGFSRYTVEELRERGGKWKDNPQRHSVALKECILILEK